MNPVPASLTWGSLLDWADANEIADGTVMHGYDDTAFQFTYGPRRGLMFAVASTAREVTWGWLKQWAIDQDVPRDAPISERRHGDFIRMNDATYYTIGNPFLELHETVHRGVACKGITSWSRRPEALKAFLRQIKAKPPVIVWHSADPEPVKYPSDVAPDTQVSDVWNARLLPLLITSDQADGPFIEFNGYVETLPSGETDADGEDTYDYGVTVQIEYGIRENGDVNQAWYQYDTNSDVRCYDLTDDGKAAAFASAKRIVRDYIENCNLYFFWDGKSEVESL